MGVGLVGLLFLGCTLDYHVWQVDIPVTVMGSGESLDTSVRTVLVHVETDCHGCICETICTELDDAESAFEEIVRLSGGWEEEGLEDRGRFEIAAWNDDDGDGVYTEMTDWDDSEGEPCAAMWLGEPYVREVPVELTVAADGCNGAFPPECPRPYPGAPYWSW